MTSQTPPSANENAVEFLACDGFGLRGVLYTPKEKSDPGVVAVLNCGGGIPAVRYANFARYLASRGVPALTYDYRGIGMSRPESLRRFAATVEDWSEHDCAGAIDWLRARYPASSHVGIAHSIGAFLVGGAPNFSELARTLFVGAHTGYYRDYHRAFRWPMAALWHGVMPVLTHAFGYFPARRLGLGEDIPRDVALRWAARRTADPKVRKRGHPSLHRSESFFRRCETATGPALLLGFSDDAFATPAGMRRFLSEFPNIRGTCVEVPARAAGTKGIGHFGFFRRAVGATLWPVALEYIQSGDLPGTFIEMQRRTLNQKIRATDAPRRG